MSFWDEKEAKRLLQKLKFYNVPIEKPRINHSKNIDLLHIEKISKPFLKICKKLKN